MVDEDLILDPKAGPSKEPTRQVEKAKHRKTKGIYIYAVLLIEIMCDQIFIILAVYSVNIIF